MNKHFQLYPMKKTTKKRLQAILQLIVDDLKFVQLILLTNNNIYCAESSGTKCNRNQQKMAKITTRQKGRP